MFFIELVTGPRRSPSLSDKPMLSQYCYISTYNNQKIYFSSLENRVLVCAAGETLEKPQETEAIKKLFSYDKKSVSIYLTTRCNLNCPYCYAKGQPNGLVIDPDFVDRFFTSYIREGNDVGQVRIQGGGEPTQAMPTLMRIVELLKNRHGIKRFWLQTNLTFTPEEARWIADNIETVYGSIDGPPRIMKRQRGVTEASSKRIEENLRYLASRGVDLAVKCTVSRYSNPFQREILDYLSGLGVKTISFEPVFRMGAAKDCHSDVTEPPRFDDFCVEFVRTKLYADTIGVSAISPLLSFEQVKEYYCGAALCEPGLTSDGCVSVCDEHFVDDGSVFIIGKAQPGDNAIRYDEAKIRTLRMRNLDNLGACRDCFLKWTCSGQCPSRTLSDTGDMFKPDAAVCATMRSHAKSYILRKIHDEIAGPRAIH